MNRTICCLEPVLAPYSIPRFKAFQLLRRDYTVRVMALGATERMYEWQVNKVDMGFEYADAFPGETVENIESHALVERVTRWLEDSDPAAVVITGYYYSAMRAAARWAKQRRRLSIYMGDSQWVDHRRNMFREWVKGGWARRHYDAAFAAGERAAAYLQRMGFPRERIWTGYDVVDNDAFAEKAAAAREEAPSLRMNLGLPERFFLFVGRFAPEKNLLGLLDAYTTYRETTNQAWGLVLVGGGPQEDLLRRKVQGLDGVFFAGYQPSDRLPVFYGLASCLILPSVSETWGLVVNEAMASGLPVLVSHRCGCVAELVRPGLNGYLCDPYDVASMTRSMTVMSSASVDLVTMGEASRQIVALFTPDTWAQSLADCIDRTAVQSQAPVTESFSRWSGFFKAEKQLS